MFFYYNELQDNDHPNTPQKVFLFLFYFIYVISALLILMFIFILILFSKFQVTSEGCPSETFANVSPEKCWEMVLQKLKQEIIRHSSLGKQLLPSLECLQGVNGLEMFGFLSPPIIQV